MEKFESERYQYLVGVGCQKSGTTSIAYFLRRNGILFPKKKELHAFSSYQFVSRSEYLRKMGVGRKPGIYWEDTPNTIYQPTSLYNLSQILPEAKLIVSFRDPIERAFSAYHHAVGEGKISRKESFTDVVTQLLEGSSRDWVANMVNIGLYGPQVRRLFRLFERSRILIVDFDEIRTDRDSMLSSKIGNFGGFDVSSPEVLQRNERGIYKSKNRAASQSIDDSIRDKLLNFYHESDHELEELTGRRFGWMDKN